VKPRRCNVLNIIETAKVIDGISWKCQMNHMTSVQDWKGYRTLDSYVLNSATLRLSGIEIVTSFDTAPFNIDGYIYWVIALCIELHV